MEEAERFEPGHTKLDKFRDVCRALFVRQFPSCGIRSDAGLQLVDPAVHARYFLTSIRSMGFGRSDREGRPLPAKST
jgi:hypothetical protein